MNGETDTAMTGGAGRARRLRLAAVTLFALACLGLAGSGVIDRAGESYTDAGFKRALVAFGIARGLNGVISVAQGTEVAFEPAGVGLIFAPGEILDPINDLVERFSLIMLVSATSLGIQGVLLDITAWPGFTLLVGAVVLLSLLLLWTQGPGPSRWRRGVFRLAVSLLVVRFAIPAIALANEGLYHLFLQGRYTTSTQQLELTTDRIGRLNRSSREQLPEREDGNLMERARRAYDSVTEALDVEGRMDELQEVAATASRHTIDLIVVFVVQTMVFPLLFIWLLIGLGRRLGEALTGMVRRVRE